MSGLTVGQLETLLLEQFPARDAESWDVTGLTVGDPGQVAGKVAVALDQTVDAVLRAKKAGANVLLTHHPTFLQPPQVFKPKGHAPAGPGAVVWEAVAQGVALMNFHTAFDVSAQAQRVFPSLLGLTQTGLLQPLAHDGAKGYGQVCLSQTPLTLGQLAHRAAEAFGSTPRVWGSMEDVLGTVVCCSGSAGSFGQAALDAGATCLVCGEVGYHRALDLSCAGLRIIEVGHDKSELPFAKLLGQAAVAVGVPSDCIVLISQDTNWRVPDSQI